MQPVPGGVLHAPPYGNVSLIIGVTVLLSIHSLNKEQRVAVSLQQFNNLIHLLLLPNSIMVVHAGCYSFL